MRKLVGMPQKLPLLTPDRADQTTSASVPTQARWQAVGRNIAAACILLLSSCGDDAANSGQQESAPAPSTVTCIVNGVEFSERSGQSVTVQGKTYEVCSNGCAYQLRRAPEEFLETTPHSEDSGSKSPEEGK